MLRCRRFLFTILACSIFGTAAFTAQVILPAGSAIPVQQTDSGKQADSRQDTKIAKHIIFSGKVQGVGFRKKSSLIAANWQLTGFVKNLRDGTVEMLVQGKPEDVATCLKEIKSFFKGNITGEKIGEVAYEPKYADFKILY